MRKFLGILVGIVAVFVITMLVEAINFFLHPPPPGFDISDQAAVAAHVASVPLVAQLVVVLAWFLGALGGGWVAAKLGHWPMAAWVMAAIVIALCAINLYQFEHPLWMKLAAVAAPLLGGWLASRLGSARPSP